METKTFETAEKKERVILVAVATSDNDDTVQSLDELEELVQTAGAETVAKVIQNRERIHPGTYIGKGKLKKSRDLYTAWEWIRLFVMMNCHRHRTITWKKH